MTFYQKYAALVTCYM